LLLLTSCNNEEDIAPTQNRFSATPPCALIVTQDTITNNSVDYTIIASSGINNSIAIEFINTTGAFSSNYSMEFIQVLNNNSCSQNSISTELVPIDGKAFNFENMPSWSIDTNTVVKAHIKLDGTSYYLADLQLNL